MDDKPILLVSALPPPCGGVATWTRTLMTEGLPDGHHFKLVDTSIRHQRNIFDKIKWNHHECIRNLRICFHFIFQIIFERPKLVHLSSSNSPSGVIREYFCGLFATLLRIPVIAHFHGHLVDFPQAKWRGLAGFFLKKLASLASINIVENGPSLLIIKELAPKVEAHVMPNFVIDQLFLDQPKTLNHGRIRAIFAGGITRNKGCRELIELAKRLPAIDFHLYGKMHDDMKSVYENKPINLFVHGVLPFEKLLNEMRKSDFLIFPSYTEGFPLTVVEAMAQGLPVIASSVGAIPEMIDEGQGGFLVPPKDVDGLVTAIQKLLSKNNDDDLLKKMGEYNRQKSMMQYRYSIVAKQLSRLYLNVTWCS